MPIWKMDTIVIIVLIVVLIINMNLTKYNAKRKLKALINRNEGTILACFMGLILWIPILIILLKGGE